MFQDQKMSAIILTSLGSMGVMANLALIAIILLKRPLRRLDKHMKGKC
jgi:hypothetical protein